VFVVATPSIEYSRLAIWCIRSEFTVFELLAAAAFCVEAIIFAIRPFVFPSEQMSNSGSGNRQI